MDPIWAQVARLIGVFTDPVNVVLLLIAIAEGAAIYFLGRYIIVSIDKNRERDLEHAKADLAEAKAMEGLTAIIKEKMSGK